MPWVNKTPVLFSHHILQRKEEWKNRFLPELLSVQLETLHVLLNPEKLAHQSWRWITCCIFSIRNLSFSTRCTQTCFLKKQQNSSFEFGDLISCCCFFFYKYWKHTLEKRAGSIPGYTDEWGSKEVTDWGKRSTGESPRLDLNLKRKKGLTQIELLNTATNSCWYVKQVYRILLYSVSQ